MFIFISENECFSEKWKLNKVLQITEKAFSRPEFINKISHIMTCLFGEINESNFF